MPGKNIFAANIPTILAYPGISQPETYQISFPYLRWQTDLYILPILSISQLLFFHLLARPVTLSFENPYCDLVQCAKH